MPRGRKQTRSGKQGISASHSAPQRTMRETAYHYIQRLVGEGRLKTGSALSELTLAKELGSSRTPIREAISQLVAEGVLEQTSAGTTLVVQLDRQDILELYELREALEVYAIDKVAKISFHATDRERLQRLVDEVLVLRGELEESGRPMLDEAQMHRFLAADLAFHSMLVSMAQNSRIQKVLSDMRLLIRIFSMDRRGHEAPLLTKIYDQHQQILNAVGERDGAAAKHILSEHIRTSLHERLEDFDHARREHSIRESLPSFLDAEKLIFHRETK